MRLRGLTANLAVMRRTIGYISFRLGRVPSLLYIAAYILLIILFSGIYYILPERPFYHSTAQYEYESLNADANKLLSTLRDRIINNLTRYYKSSQPKIRDWVLDTRSFTVDSLSVRNFPEEFNFQVGAPLSRIEPRGKVETYEHRLVIVPLKGKMIIEGVVYLFPKLDEAAPISIAEFPPEPNLQELLPDPGRLATLSGPVLGISVDLYNNIIGFGQGYRGFPAKVKGHYLRMLYFSAGIATSTALGDIVPITPLARLLVTIEALCALVIVGLFLNALAVDIGNRREAP
jgi:hypothetical protein